MSRRTFDAVGAFICASAEDLAFFHAHIDRVPRAEYPLVRTCVYSCIYVYICICLCIYVYVYVYVCPDEPSTLSVLFFFCAPAEDLALFHAHLDNVPRAERPLVRSSAPFVYDKCTPMKHLTPPPPTTTTTTAAGPQRLTPAWRHHYNTKGGTAFETCTG